MKSNELWRDGLTQSQLHELNSSSNYQSFLHITEVIITFSSASLEMAAVNPSHPSPPALLQIWFCPLLGLLFLSLPLHHISRPTQPSQVPNLGAWAPSLVNREKLSIKSSLRTTERAFFFQLSMIPRTITESTLPGGVSQSPEALLHHVNPHLFIRHFHGCITDHERTWKKHLHTKPDTWSCYSSHDSLSLLVPFFSFPQLHQPGIENKNLSQSWK